MKRILCFWVLMLATSAAAQQLLLFEDFESSVLPAFPAGWTVEDANGDLVTWETKPYGGLDISPRCVQYSGTSVAAGDWFFTPPLALTTGIPYTVHFMYKVSSAANPEKLSIWIGSAPTSASMSVQIHDYSSLTNTTLEQASVDFTVMAGGTYYIGFRCYSDANQRRLFIDDIDVAKPQTDLVLDVGLWKGLFDPTPVPTFSLADTIETAVTLKNVGSGSPLMNERFLVGNASSRFPELSFIVTGPTGDTLPFVLMYEKVGKPTAQNFKVLAPDETTGKVYDLQIGFSFLQVGTYTVRALYRNYHKHPDGLDVWLGRILSEPITFTLE